MEPSHLGVVTKIPVTEQHGYAMRRALQTAIVLITLSIATPIYAQEWHVTGDNARSEKIVQRYLALLEANPERPLILRKLVEQTGRGPRLGTLIQQMRARSEATASPRRWVLTGHLLSAQNRPTEALEAYRRALDLAPDDANVHAALGEALEETGNEEAAEHFEQALQLTDTAAQKRRLLRRLTDRAMYAGDIDDALVWLERLSALAGNDLDILLELGQAYRRVRRHDDALDVYRRALERAGRNGKRRAQLYQDIGAVQHDLRDFVSAEQAYRKALAVVGRRSWMRREVLMRLVEVARDAQRLPEMYEELVAEWPNPPYVDTMNLAGLAEELGRDDDAIRWLERAIRLNRRGVEPRQRLISRLERRGDHDRVGELFDELARMHPNDALKQIERIEWLYFRKEKATAALDDLRALEARFSDPVTQVEIARTWARFGLPNEALRVHGALLDSAPENPHNLEVYGELLHRLGRTEASEDILLRLLDSDLGPLHARLRLADVYGRLGRTDRATEVLEWCVAHEPKMSDVRQRLAAAYERSARWGDAAQQWERLFLTDGVSHAGTRIVQIAERTWDRELLDRWELHYEREPTVRIGYILGRLRLAVDGRLSEGPRLLTDIAGRDPSTLDPGEQAAWIGAVDESIRLTEQRGDIAKALDLLVRLAAHFGDRRLGAWHQIAELAFHPSLSSDATEDWLRRAVRAVPNSAYVHAQYGVFLASDGRAEAAAHQLHRAVRLGTTDFDVHLDLVHQLDELGRPDEARAVLLDVIRRDRSGKWASGAAFSALDRCETDAQLVQFEQEIRRLQGRIAEDTYRSIMVATYQQLFAYSDDPAAAFASLGRRALPLLVEALQSTSEDARGRAMTLLNLYPAPVVAQAAGDAWNDTAHWQPEAIWVLARAGTKRGRDLVLGALGSDDVEVREIATFAAGQQGVREAIPALVAVLCEPTRTFDEQSLAAYALSHFDDQRAIDALISVAQNDEAGAIRRIAVWSLGKIQSPRSTEALVSLLDTPQESLRTAAAIALAQHRTDGSLRAQLGAFWGPSSLRRASAKRSLRTGLISGVLDLQPDLAEPIPDLGGLAVALIHDSLEHPPTEPTIRRFADRPQLLGDVVRTTLQHGEGRRVLADLVTFADDTLSDLDSEAMKRVVVDIRPELLTMAQASDGELVAPAARLLPLASQPRDYSAVARAVARLPAEAAAPIYPALGSYGWSSIEGAVTQRLAASDTDPNERATHLRVLRRADPPDDPGIAKILLRLAAEDHLEVRIAAIEALGAIGHDDATEPLVALFESSDEPTRAAVVRSLEAMDTKASRKAVVKLLTVPIRRPCRGDQDNLSDLLRDECLGVFDAAEF